jgi:hypothetical protein
MAEGASTRDGAGSAAQLGHEGARDGTGGGLNAVAVADYGEETRES